MEVMLCDYSLILVLIILAVLIVFSSILYILLNNISGSVSFISTDCHEYLSISVWYEASFTQLKSSNVFVCIYVYMCVCVCVYYICTYMYMSASWPLLVYVNLSHQSKVWLCETTGITETFENP